jgi:D-glycero-D-manno-heptose 1,7-bisphosphate phosphatase
MTGGAPKKRRAIFLDRDGTLNADLGFVADPARVQIVPHAIEGARALADAGFALVVVSNQSGIARGLMSEQQADEVDRRVRDIFTEHGVELAAFYRCPHLPDGANAAYARDCDCRKPKPGMLLRAAKDLNIDLSSSWAVGDRPRDIAAGRAAGCRTVAVVGVPPPEKAENYSAAAPEYRARDLADAARYIIEHS